MAEDVIEQRFPVEHGAELRASNIAGSVLVRPGEAGEIHVRAVKTGAQRAMDNTCVEFGADGNRVRVQTKGERGGLINLSRMLCNVEYIISVPRDCRVGVECVSADVRVEGVHADVQVKTVSGEVVLTDVSGDNQATTVSGNIRAEGVVGALTARTTSGDTAVQRSRLGHFNVNSVSGDFAIETPFERGRQYLAKTVSGDLVLRLDGEVGATVQMRSVSGQVYCEVPAQVINAGRRNWQGRIGGGEAAVEMHTISGDMRILGGLRGISNPAQPPSPLDPFAATPSPAPERQEAGAILRALEQGEIGVEEALSALDHLR